MYLYYFFLIYFYIYVGFYKIIKHKSIIHLVLFQYRDFVVTFIYFLNNIIINLYFMLTIQILIDSLVFMFLILFLTYLIIALVIFINIYGWCWNQLKLIILTAFFLLINYIDGIGISFDNNYHVFYYIYVCLLFLLYLFPLYYNSIISFFISFLFTSNLTRE